MSLSLKQVDIPVNLDANLNHFSAFLNKILEKSNQDTSDQFETFSKIDHQIHQQLSRVIMTSNASNDIMLDHPATDHSVSINWVQPVLHDYDSVPFRGLTLRTAVVIGTPETIKQFVQVFKPLADQHLISLIVSKQPVSVQLNEINDFDDWLYETVEIINTLTTSKALRNEILLANLMNPNINKDNVWAQLPLLSHHQITQKYDKPSYASYQLLIVVYQFVTWLSKIS